MCLLLIPGGAECRQEVAVREQHRGGGLAAGPPLVCTGAIAGPLRQDETMRQIPARPMVTTEDGLDPELREALRIPRIAQTDDVGHQDVVVR